MTGLLALDDPSADAVLELCVGPNASLRELEHEVADAVREPAVGAGGEPALEEADGGGLSRKHVADLGIVPPRQLAHARDSEAGVLLEHVLDAAELVAGVALGKRRALGHAELQAAPLRGRGPPARQLEVEGRHVGRRDRGRRQFPLRAVRYAVRHLVADQRSERSDRLLRLLGDALGGRGGWRGVLYYLGRSCNVNSHIWWRAVGEEAGVEHIRQFERDEFASICVGFAIGVDVV